MLDIFLSYSRQDEEMMDRLRNDLQSAGFRVWTDEGLLPGTPSWQRAIEEVIRNVRCMVVILSPSAKQSEWVEVEFSYARQIGKPIFPVLVRGDIEDAVPFSLTLTQFVDIRGEYSRVETQLIPALRQYWGGVDVSPPLAPTTAAANDAKGWEVSGGVKRFLSIATVVVVVLIGLYTAVNYIPRMSSIFAPSSREPASTATHTLTATPTPLPTDPTASPTRHLPATATARSEAASATVPVEAEAPASEAESSEPVLYSHDFSFDDGNWFIGSVPSDLGTAKTSLTNGKYRFTLTVSQSSSYQYRFPLIDYVFDNFILSVEATLIKQPVGEPVAYGIIFRRQGEEDKWYELRLNDRGRYKVNLRDEDYVALVDWTESAAINNNGTNQIEIKAVDSALSFSVNGQVLTEITDDTWEQGRIYFFIRNSGLQSATLDFDNLVIKEAP